MEIEWKQNGHFKEKSLIFTAFWFEIIKVKTPKFFPVGQEVTIILYTQISLLFPMKTMGSFSLFINVNEEK